MIDEGVKNGIYTPTEDNALNDLKKFQDNFLFDLKSSFHSRDNQMFGFLSSHLFLHVSHCFRGCSKVNLKVYDIINCLHKNLTTQFVWYLEKEKKYDSKILSIDRVLNKKHIKKSCWKYAPKATPRSLFDFGK